ncbi:MAG: methionine adenosyltransferase [Micrococcales bacterium]|nr:methionine adenosyltransferase [Micrococcales bacterium]
MTNRHLFTSESVTGGHPDKICDQISDGVLDALLTQDPGARVAVESLVSHGQVVVAGEVTTSGYVPVADIARQVLLDLGYNTAESGIDGAACGVSVLIEAQSPEIAAGVNVALEARTGQAGDAYEKQGAGDQGLVFGYACNETEQLMPLPISLAHALAERLQSLRLDGALPMLWPDGKTQVTVEYAAARPVGLDTVVISAQHRPQVDQAELAALLSEQVINPVLEPVGLAGPRRVLVNPSGSFVHGGPSADTGLTGRKLIVDTYGGMARHGGGAFSGKDPSKVDRTGCYAARWVAKTVVAAGLAQRCEVLVAYAIGAAEPVSLATETFGTGRVDDDVLAAAVGKVFDLRPAALVETLDLNRPIYRPLATFGHFGRPGLTWEDTSRAEALLVTLGS